MTGEALHILPCLVEEMWVTQTSGSLGIHTVVVKSLHTLVKKMYILALLNSNNSPTLIFFFLQKIFINVGSILTLL